MPTTVTDSPNISVWDSKVIANTCDGNFYVDASPSVFIGSGASNVLGAKVKIKNPYGVVIKDYTASYDIPPPLTAPFSYAIPTQGGAQQKGIYTISLQVTDADSKTYEVVKQVNVCDYSSDTYPCDERVRITANCTSGKVSIAIAEPPVFKGKFAESRVQEWTVYYPTISELPPFTTTNSNFSVQLFEGVYRVKGFVCARYNMGDNVFIDLNYSADIEKNIKCLLDYTCIWPRIKRMNEKIASNCTEREKQETSEIVLDALRLITTIELANKAGEDPSPYISELEELLGCQCTCDCSASPIIGGTPASDIIIEGCNVEAEVTGLTTTYTIDNFVYIVEVDPLQNVITVSAPASAGACTIKQQLNFSAANAYAAMKAQVNTMTEYQFWSAVVNNTLNSLDASCLGYTPTQWAALPFSSKFNALIVAACAGGVCTATISAVTVTKVGSNVKIAFTQTGGSSADIYVDGVFKGNMAAGVNEFIVVGYTDGIEHDYSIVPKCSNGAAGTAHTGSFTFLACPTIPPPTIGLALVPDAECPFDLTSLETAPPAGIEIEWHNLNNTNPSSLVGDPTAVSGGVYYAFSKDANGCYSTASQVTLICEEAASCTAPQGLSVTPVAGDFKVSFSAAVYPPPSNSYTVKRKPAASPDVDGSYTTIGTPTYNSSTNKWEIMDTSGVDGTLYTYKAISNCAGSSPSILYTYANLPCPTVTLTPTATDISYSFPHIGGDIDKYEVSLWDASGTTQIATSNEFSPFSNPTTGSFLGLTGSTNYKVRVKIFIGSYSTTCAFTSVTTSSPDSISGGTSMSLGVTSISGTITIVSPAGRTLRLENFSTCGFANATVTVSGGITALNSNINTGFPNTSQTVDRFLPAGTYTYSGTFGSSASCTGGATISLI